MPPPSTVMEYLLAEDNSFGGYSFKQTNEKDGTVTQILEGHGRRLNLTFSETGDVVGEAWGKRLPGDRTRKVANLAGKLYADRRLVLTEIPIKPRGHVAKKEKPKEEEDPRDKRMRVLEEKVDKLLSMEGRIVARLEAHKQEILGLVDNSELLRELEKDAVKCQAFACKKAGALAEAFAKRRDEAETLLKLIEDHKEAFDHFKNVFSKMPMPKQD